MVKISTPNAVIDTFFVIATTHPANLWSNDVKVFIIFSLLQLIDITSIPISSPVRGVYLQKKYKSTLLKQG